MGMEGLCGSGYEPGGVAVGDWNGDGAADIAASYPKYGAVILCAGDGEGGFTKIGEAAVGRGAAFLAFGRLGGADGGPAEPFLAVVNPSFDRIDLLFAAEGDSLAPRYPFFPTGGDPADVAVGYLDEEERIPFIATANRETEDATLVVWDGEAFRTDTLAVAGPGRPNPYPSAIAAGDLDGDGRRDDLLVAARKYDLVYTFTGDEDGRMERRFDEVRTGRAPSAVAIGSLGGGVPYFIVTSGLDRGATFFRHDPESRFGFRRFADIGGGRRPVAADILGVGETGVSYFAMVERRTERWVIHLVDGEGEVQLLEQMRDIDKRLHDGKLGFLRDGERPFIVTAGERLVLYPLFVIEEGRMH